MLGGLGKEFERIYQELPLIGRTDQRITEYRGPSLIIESDGNPQGYWVETKLEGEDEESETHFVHRSLMGECLPAELVGRTLQIEKRGVPPDLLEQKTLALLRDG